jgi:hypothetical protein
MLLIVNFLSATFGQDIFTVKFLYLIGTGYGHQNLIFNPKQLNSSSYVRV